MRIMGMKKKTPILCAVTALWLMAVACNLVLPQTQPTIAPQTAVATGPSQDKLPLTEAEVPRVSVEDAKAAFDSGEAIILDVRSSAAFAQSHIAGALSIQLGEIETNAAGLDLDKNQWIITYCT